MLTIADDLIILTVGLKQRVGPNNGLLSPRFALAIRGAELITLASAGRVEVDEGIIRVREATPLGDPGLDAALASANPDAANRAGAASTAPPVEVRAWMNAAPYGSVTARFERLADAGLLRGERYKLLLMVPRTGYRLANEFAAQRFEQLRARLHAAVTATGPIDADELALVGLVHAGAITYFAYPGKAGEQARARIAELAKRAGLAADAEKPSKAPDPSLDPNRMFPPAPGPAERHHHHPSAPHPNQPAAQAAVSAAVQAAVAASVGAAVAATVDAASHHHTAGGSGSTDSAPVHHHH